ncbi:MAG: PepSY-associated TM helix domain-containing protein [Rhodocyclaceae bacterium]
MRTEFVRIYKSVHTWTGILSGMALFIAFYAGALTVFKEPLARWATPPSLTVSVPLADTQALIVKTLAANPTAARDFSIQLEEIESTPARMSWQVRDAGADDHDESAVRHFMATLDASGAAHVSQSQPSTLGSFIDVLHRVVGLPFDNDPSRWVMGIVAALYALALISGVIVLLPSLVKDFFALRVGKNLKRMWLDAHNVVGIISLPFHIVMALTAVVFAFHDQIYDAQDKLVHQGKWAAAFQRPTPKPGSAPPARDVAAMLTPVDIVAKAQALSVDFKPEILQYQQVTGPRAVVRVWGKDASAVSPRARGGFVAFDPYSGKLLNTDYMPGRQDVPNLFISSFFALHMASFGTVAVQWMYFVLGLAGAWLFYSGNLLWVESRRRRAAAHSTQVPVQRLDTRLMAAATVGVCLGCVCGISLMTAASKWLHGHVADLGAAIRIVYYAAFFAALAWAFVRGAGAAAIHLLWLCALATLAIPVTTLLAWLVPALGWWAHVSAATLGVDLTALAGALCLAWMARATSRRLRNGRPDSVWTVSPRTGPDEVMSAQGRRSPA